MVIHFDISKLQKDLKDLENQTTNANFWEDSQNSSYVLKQITSLKNKIQNYIKIDTELKNMIEMNELLNIEPEEEIGKELLKSTFQISNHHQNKVHPIHGHDKPHKVDFLSDTKHIVSYS